MLVFTVGVRNADLADYGLLQSAGAVFPDRNLKFCLVSQRLTTVVDKSAANSVRH